MAKDKDKKSSIPKEPKPGTPAARVRKAKQQAQREAGTAEEALEETKEAATDLKNKGYHAPKAAPAKKGVKAARKAGKYAGQAKNAAKGQPEEVKAEADEAVDAADEAEEHADEAKRIAELGEAEIREAEAEADSEVADEDK